MRSISLQCVFIVIIQYHGKCHDQHRRRLRCLRLTIVVNVTTVVAVVFISLSSWSIRGLSVPVQFPLWYHTWLSCSIIQVVRFYWYISQNTHLMTIFLAFEMLKMYNFRIRNSILKSRLSLINRDGRSTNLTLQRYLDSTPKSRLCLQNSVSTSNRQNHW